MNTEDNLIEYMILTEWPANCIMDAEARVMVK